MPSSASALGVVPFPAKASTKVWKFAKALGDSDDNVARLRAAPGAEPAGGPRERPGQAAPLPTPTRTQRPRPRPRPPRARPAPAAGRPATYQPARDSAAPGPSAMVAAYAGMLGGSARGLGEACYLRPPKKRKKKKKEKKKTPPVGSATGHAQCGGRFRVRVPLAALLSHVQPFVTPWAVAHQVPLSP